MEEKKRYDIIDSLRAICVFVMIFYHTMFDLYLWADLPSDIMFSPLLNTIQFVFASLFIVISGLSSALSRNALKRGIYIAAAALCVTVTTYFMDNDNFVVFGILHFLALSSFIYHFTPKFKINPYFCVLAYLITYYIINLNINAPHLWVFGITDDNFNSSDYFPLLPWIFVYYFGVFLGGLFKDKAFPSFVYDFKCKFLSFIGKKSMIIYLLHQPILYFIIYPH